MKNKFILVSWFLLLILAIIFLLFLQKEEIKKDSKKWEVIKKLDNNKTDIIYSSTWGVQHSQASDIE